MNHRIRIANHKELPPGDYVAMSLADFQSKVVSVQDEVFAATAYLMEFGRLELGTPQSKRLIEASRRLGVLADGRKPIVPADYPMTRNPD